MIDLSDIVPIYHDFRLLGGHHGGDSPHIRNQGSKAPIIQAYTHYALARAGFGATFMELFCADAYYAMYARQAGAARAVGVDDNRYGFLDSARRIAERLDLTGLAFVESDVAAISTASEVVANVGGLYHVSDPRGVLEHSARLARRYLIVQSVVTLASDAEDYFVTPAPGWTWGCRMSARSFDRMILEVAGDAGFRVVARHENELAGNARAEDRGSVYYLLETGGVRTADRRSDNGSTRA